MLVIQHGIRSGTPANLARFPEVSNKHKSDDGVRVGTGSRSGHAPQRNYEKFIQMFKDWSELIRWCDSELPVEATDKTTKDIVLFETML